MERVLASLSLDERIDQMLLAYPQLDREAPVKVGGVLFVGKSLDDVPAAKARIAASTARARVPPLYAVDMEGGRINRLRHLPSVAEVPSALAMSRLPDAEVEQWGFTVGQAMREVGLNVNLAPVLDVAGTGHLFDGERTFGGDPAVVAAKGRAYCEGLRRAGVASVGKHYPGYGDLAADSDHVRVAAPWPRERVQREAGVFARVGAAPMQGVMLSNVIYDAIGPQPAVLSPDIVAMGHARGWLTVTDDLAIGTLATALGGKTEDVVRAAFLAGNDLLLTTAPPDWEQGIDYHAVIARAVAEDPARKARVDDAARRVLGLKDRLGLLDGR
ncbi:MAG: glycoside hydrolase family 3 N-terminal domain-containing protein [Myxococcota bacterium]